LLRGAFLAQAGRDSGSILVAGFLYWRYLMRRWQLLVVLVLCLVLAGSVFASGKSVTVSRFAGEVQSIGPQGSRQDCQVGNLNPMYYLIADWIWGAEGYKFLFDPMATCQCEAGFHLETVHLALDFGAEDVPTSFDVYVDLEEAIWDPVLQCWFPGPEVCVSQVYTIDITEAGTYDIAIPIIDECNCAAMEFLYLISFHIVGEFDPAMRPGIITDEFPTNCTSWNDYGSGWLDLVFDFGFPGNLILWGDVTCCEFPVGAEENTWGGVKNLYK